MAGAGARSRILPLSLPRGHNVVHLVNECLRRTSAVYLQLTAVLVIGFLLTPVDSGRVQGHGGFNPHEIARGSHLGESLQYADPWVDYTVDVRDTGSGASVTVFGVNLTDGSPSKGAKLVAVVGPTNLTFASEPISSTPGAYAISIYVSDPGEYSFRILSCKSDDACNVISNAVYAFNVGGALSASQSCASGYQDTYTAGELASFNITAEDSQGIVETVTYYPCPFTVNISSVVNGGLSFLDNQVVPQGQGIYTVMFVPTRVQVYSVSVSLDEAPIYGGQFSFTTRIDAPSVAEKYILSNDDNWERSNTLPAGDHTFFITCTDTSYQVINNFSIVVTQVENFSQVLYSLDCPDSRLSIGCSFELDITVPGNYSVDVYLLGEPLQNAPYILEIVAGMAERYASQIAVKYAGILAGETISYQVALSDSYGNPALSVFQYAPFSPRLAVVLYSSLEPIYGNITAFPNNFGDPIAGKYLATFNITVVGNFTVVAYFGFSDLNILPGSRFTLIVSANAPSAERSFLDSFNNVTVGTSLLLRVYLRDGYDNSVFGNMPVEVTVFNDISNYTFPCALAAERYEALIQGIVRADDYQVNVSVSGSPLLGGYQLHVIGGPVDPENCSFIGLQDGVAGVRSSFVLQLADLYGNVGTLDADTLVEKYLSIYSPTGDNYADVHITSLSAGFYNVTYFATKARKYVVSFWIGHKQITSEVFVFPGGLDLRQSAISGPGTIGGIVNKSLDVYITPRDSYGNRVHVNDLDKSMFKISGMMTPFSAPWLQTATSGLSISPLALDLLTDTYTFQYISLVSGRVALEVNLVGVTYEIRSTLSSGRLSIHNTYLDGAGLNGTSSNRSAVFYINAYDAYGNMKNDPGSIGEAFRVVMCSKSGACSSSNIYVVDVHFSEGRYMVVYQPPTSGNYTIFVSWNGKDVSGSPLVVPVVDPLVERMLDPSQFILCGGISTASLCQGLVSPSAGEVQNFTVTAADSQGIPLLSGGERFVLSVVPDVSLNGNIEDQSNGNYFIHYCIYKAGNFTLTLTHNSVAVFVQQISVTPATTSAAKSSLVVPLPATLSVGIPYASAIIALDGYSNERTYGGGLSDRFEILASKSTGEQVAGTVLLADNGSVIVSLVTCSAGVYNLSVLLNGELLTGGNQLITFLPGAPNLSSSRIIYNDISVVGEVATIRVFPVDAYGNDLTKDLNCSATAVDIHGGVFAAPYCDLSGYPILVSYNLTGVGIYYITFHMYHSSGTGFRFTANVTVRSGEPDAQNSGIVDQVGFATKTGVLSTVLIRCQDTWGNICMRNHSKLFSVSLRMDGFSAIFANLSFDGTHVIASYVLYSPGNYSGQVELRGEPVSKGFFTATASPAPSSAYYSCALYGSQPAGVLNTTTDEATLAAGSVAYLKVLVFDMYGNRQDRSVADVLNVTFLPAFSLPPYVSTGAKVLDVEKDYNDNGVYTVSFSAKTANYHQGNSYIPVRYLLSVELIERDGLSYHISGSPFRFLVTPGPVNVPKTILRQTESWCGESGLMWMLTLIPQDTFGNAGPFDSILNVTADLAEVTDFESSYSFRPDGFTEDWLSSSGYDDLLEMEQILQGKGNGSGLMMPPMIVDNYNGSVVIYFTVTKSGFYNISVFVNSALVGGPLYTITNYEVLPGPVDMKRLVPTGLGFGYKATVAGQLSLILLQFTDRFGNLVNVSQSGGSELVANLTARFRVRVWSQLSFNEFFDEDVVAKKNISFDGDGRLWLYYQPLKSGQLILNLGYSDTGSSLSQEIFGSPFYGTVEPGTVLSSNCAASGPGLHSALACNKYQCPNNSIFLEARDSYDNVVNSESSPSICQSFTVIAGPSLTFLTPVPYDGRCLLRYTASKVSTQNIAIQYLWSPILSSPFQVTVRPTVGDASPIKSVAWGDLGGTIIAGKSATITVQLVDSNGVELHESPPGTANYVNIVLVNSTIGVYSPTLISRNNHDGTCTLKLTPLSSGFYSFKILVGQLKLPLRGNYQGYALRAVSGPTVASKAITILSSNRTSYRAGEDAVVIQVQGMDKIGNLQDYVMGSADFYEAHIFQPDGASIFVPLTQKASVSDTGVPYIAWELNYVPLQAPTEGSLYNFRFVWTDGYLRQDIQTKISVPTSPGEASLEHTHLIGQGALTAVSGEQATFLFQLYDAHSNPIRTRSDIVGLNITVLLAQGSEIIEVNCNISTVPFGWRCWYTASISGSYSLQVALQGTETKSFPNVTVGPAPAYAPYCTAFGNGVGTGSPIYAGVPARFVIQPYDIFGNQIVMDGDFFAIVLVMYNETTSSYLRPASIYPRWTGKDYEVVYTPVRAGYGEVYVRLGSFGGENIQNSPFAIQVNPGPASAEHTIWRASSFGRCMAGDMHSLTLVSRDRYDNVRPTGKDIFVVSKHVQDAPDESDVSKMTPLGNGVYQYLYRCQRACSTPKPNCTSITVSVGEATVLRTNLGVVPGPADISNCIATLLGHSLAAGSKGSLFIVSKDSFSNQLQTGGLEFQVMITSGDVNSSITNLDNEDGTYLFEYRILTSGNHTIQALLHGQVFFTDRIEVVPGPPDVLRTRVSFNSGGYVSGVPAYFQIQLFDEFLNPITEDVLEQSLLLLSLTSTLIPPTTTYVETTTFFTGSLYNVSFTPDHPGILQLNLNVSGEMVFEVNNSSPFSAMVASGPPAISNFAVFGAGIEAGGIVNQAATFFVHVKDLGGNVVSSRPLGTWGLTFSPTNVVPIRPAPFFLQNGTIQFTYIPVRPASDLAITVLYGGQRVGSTRYVKIKTQPGFWSLKNCVALDPFGVPLDRSLPLIGRVGSNLTVTIQIKDKDGMDISVPDPSSIAFLATVSGVPVAVGPTSRGAYGFTLSNAQSRKYVVEISSLDGLQFIKNSGFVIFLLPDLSHPPNTLVLTSDGLQPLAFDNVLVAGEETIMQLQAYDPFGNAQLYTPLQSPDIFSASLVSLDTHGLFNSYLSLYNCGNKHSLHLTPYLAGDYLLTIYLNEMFAGSHSLHVRPGALNFSNFEVFPPVLLDVLAGVESTFELRGRDFYFSTCDEGAMRGQISVELQPADGSKPTPATLFSKANSTAVLVSFVVPLQGWYSIVVLDATSKASSNLPRANWTRSKSVHVRAGPISSSTLLTTLPSEDLLAGEFAEIRFTALDTYGNMNYSIPEIIMDPSYDVEVTSTCLLDTLGELDTCGAYSFSTSFLPTLPGPVNISLTWKEAVVSTVLQINPAKEPVLVSARLSDSLTYITILFDKATDAGYEIKASTLNGSARCSVFLDVSVVGKLGTYPSCIFRDPWTMLIYLGYNASILPANSDSPDFITLMDNAIYAAGNSSLAATGSSLLLQPTAPLAPTAKLLAPSFISPCDSLMLDASGSSGSGGRPLQFYYSIRGTGDQEVLVSVGRWLKDIPSSRMHVVINAEMLQAGQKYTFSVTVINFVGARNQASVTVTTTHFAVPLLTTMVGDDILVGTRGDLFEVEALASLPVMAVLEVNRSCTPITPSIPVPSLQYQWSQTGGPILDVSSIIWDTRVLAVSGELLRVGVVYNFSVQCSLFGFSLSVSTAQVALAVESSPLAVAIIGGNRTINSSQKFTLVADVYDADNLVDVNGKPYQLTYGWKCDPDLGPSRMSPFYEVTAANGFGQAIEIPGGYLPSGVYNFSVTVDKVPSMPGRVGVTAWVMVTAGIDVLTVTTTIDNAAFMSLGISPSMQVKVVCTNGFVDYNWSITSNTDQRDLLNISRITNSLGYWLLISPNTLLPGTAYTVSCSARSNIGLTGHAGLNFFTLTDPTGGSVDISADSSPDIAGQTLYSLVAHGWTSSVGKRKLMYEFRYTLGSGSETVLQPLSPLNFVGGAAVKAGNVTFRVYVADSGGQIFEGDAPQGALFELPPIIVGIPDDQDATSFAESSPLAQNALLSNFFTARGQGEYLKGLSFMEIFGSLYIQKNGTQCRQNSAIMPVVNEMLAWVEASDWQHPATYVRDMGVAGSGPYCAVALACALGQVFQEPGNVELQHLEAALNIFYDKLAILAAQKFSASAASGHIYNPCFFDAVDALINSVGSSCAGAPYNLIERASQMPILLARILLNDNFGFPFPSYVVRPAYSLVATSVDLLPEMENNLTSSLESFQLNASTWAGEGTLGVAIACFPAFAPLGSWDWAAIKGYQRLVAVFQTCDFLLSGVNDSSAVSATVSFLNLKPPAANTTYAIAGVNKDFDDQVSYLGEGYEDGKISLDIPKTSASRVILVQIVSESIGGPRATLGYNLLFLVLGAILVFR